MLWEEILGLVVFTCILMWLVRGIREAWADKTNSLGMKVKLTLFLSALGAPFAWMIVSDVWHML